MDDLDKQLAQLQLLNNRDLSPKPHGLVKKVGPAVPPKPKKTQPQAHVPTHNLYSNMKMTLDNPAVLEQKLEALEHHKKVLENQQARRLQLAAASGGGGGQQSTKLQPPATAQSHQTQSSAVRTINTTPHDSQRNNNGASIYENQQMLYENIKHNENAELYANNGTGERGNSRSVANDHIYDSGYHNDGKNNSSLIYSNITHGTVGGNVAGSRNGIGASKDMVANPYSNMSYDGNAQDDLPPPPLDIVASLNLVDNEYHTQASEEDLPPPPSPVSSSYSELRRATDNTSYPSMPGYPMSQSNYQHLNVSMGGGSGGAVRSSDIGGAAGSGGVANITDGMTGNHHHGSGAAHMMGHDMMQQTYANNYQPEYGTYVPSSQSFNSDYACFGSSQGSSTYESIYEPINPRPPSQMSSRSNYSLYTPYVSGPQSVGGSGTVGGGGGSSNTSTLTKIPNHKEAEVDVLTDLLVQSMDGSQDNDTYGICMQCGERVVGESSGCTAMEQIYHIACFTCCQCQINLQGKPFYALDGKPCCEEDYLNTLEKCSVCMKPILERILRATGKPYHPGCFCCVVCGKSLDGVPFTVDATNQNHCIEDFHKKFAPRCCVCRQPIMPEPGKEETVRVVALDRSFHVSCYKCEDCGLLLSSEAEGRGCFPLDDHILCKSCNAKRVQALTSHMTTEL